MAGVLLSLAGSCALVQNIEASSTKFTDQSRDLILTFREAGAPDVLEVDIGQASIYYGAAAGSSIPITAYDPSSQLLNYFNVDGLSWSVGGCVPNAGDSGDSSKPPRTLWLSDPRGNPSTKAQPWTSESSSTQGGTDSHVVAVLANAQTWANAAAPDSVTNTTTALVIPAGSGDTASGSLGALGNYLGTFQGDVENTTPQDFDSAGSPSRSDLYELQPGSGSGTYLGYFELGTDGSMTFHAPSLVVTYPAPTLSVLPDGLGNVLVKFQSTLGGTYTLHSVSADGLAAPIATWPTVGSAIVGDGNIDSFTQPISGTGAVYSVTVH